MAEASNELVKGALAGLARRFNDDVVQIDESVHNLSRITKLYGTVNVKGDNTERTPWRLSRLIVAPARTSVISSEQLLALRPAISQVNGQPHPRVDGLLLEDLLARLDIPYERDVHNGRERFRLQCCPFNADHGKGEAAIFRAADGKLGFKCSAQLLCGQDVARRARNHSKQIRKSR